MGIPGVGNGSVSDLNESHYLFQGLEPAIYISNGFTTANSAEISTCGGLAQSYHVRSFRLNLDVQFTESGQNYTTPVDLSILESTYHYEFPADFGEWAVDNLSAAGGPGGGWAFSYSPCSP